MKISKNTSKSHEDLALLDRNKCFSLVATAVNDVVTDSVVDLKSPEVKTRKPFRNSVMYRFLLIFIAAFLLIKLNGYSYQFLWNCYPSLGYPRRHQWLPSQFFHATLSPLSRDFALRHCYLIQRLRVTGRKSIEALKGLKIKNNPLLVSSVRGWTCWFSAAMQVLHMVYLLISRGRCEEVWFPMVIT